MAFFESFRKEEQKKSAKEYENKLLDLYKHGYRGEFKLSDEGKKIEFEIKPIGVKSHKRSIG